MTSAVTEEKALTKEGLTAYFEQFLNGPRGEASADVLADVVLLAVSEEREACAQTAADTWSHLTTLGSQMTQNYSYACEKAAERIRARFEDKSGASPSTGASAPLH